MTSVQRIDTTAQESEWYNFTKQKNEMDKETKNMEVQVSIDNEMLRFDNFQASDKVEHAHEVQTNRVEMPVPIIKDRKNVSQMMVRPKKGQIGKA